MKVESLDAKQSEMAGVAQQGGVSPHQPILRSIQFRTNVTDGFKFVAVMITERYLPGQSPMLSAWTLFGSLKPLKVWAEQEKNPEFVESLPLRLPVVSSTFNSRKAFRPGRSLHVYGEASFGFALSELADFRASYFDGKAGHGYCTPGEVKAGYFSGRTNTALWEVNRHSYCPETDWHFRDEQAIAPPIILPPVFTLGGPRRRITSIFPTNQ